MYFKIIKKTGERAIEFVKSVRSYELCQVHPHWEWYKNSDGAVVNYFVYTSLRNLDLYVECDKEFVDIYNSKYIADMMINYVNDAISAFSGMPYKHIMNLDEACRFLNVVPFHMSQAKMIKYVELFREWYDHRKTYKFNREEEYLRQKHGVTFYVQEFENRDGVATLSQCWLALKDGGCIKYNRKKYYKKETITDEETIENYNEICKQVDEMRAVAETLEGRDKTKQITESNKLASTVSNISKDVVVEDGKQVTVYTKTTPATSKIAEYYTPERFSHTTTSRVMGIIPFDSPIKIYNDYTKSDEWINVDDKLKLKPDDNMQDNHPVDDNIVLG